MKKIDALLGAIQKPGRYVGGEWNAVKKEWSEDKTKFLLSFPDTYEVGMSHLGLKILYGILNQREDCICERAFSPWNDFEAALRAEDAELFSLESRRPIRDFNIVGFSIGYELCYTNILNFLDLSKIPLKSSERKNEDPLVIAGGPSCYNPEPIAEFIDAFVIGDGEDVILEVLDRYKELKASGVTDRKKILLEFAQTISGLYIPSLYSATHKDDGTIASFKPTEKGIPEKIIKRVAPDLNKAFFPVKQIVPNIQIIHDRIAIEIMRGCKHLCRFCQATTTYRPWRERSLPEILRIARESYANTGYDEISLLSLSSGDHSCAREIIDSLSNEFTRKAVSLSVPSLRVEEIAKDLPSLISEVKKSGLTFAPEAASKRLRSALNKNIDIEKLFTACLGSFKAGWKRVKLYFMIGLPTETMDDVSEIAELIRKISELKREVDKRPAEVTASINAFVPKPHTPLQWEAMEPRESLEQKKRLIKDAVRSKMISLDFHSFDRGSIEAALARGDRRMSTVIYIAWRSGARFDGWQEMFSYERWISAFKEAGLDPAFYIHRKRDFNEILPWDHIDIGLSKESLIKEAMRAHENNSTPSFDKESTL